MQWWLQTRGRSIDYPQGILSPHGPLPPWWSPWWQDFRDATSPEEPMFLVETRPAPAAPGWRLYVTAMDAGRRDSKGRAIRTSLLATGSPDEHPALGLLLATWLDGRLAQHLRDSLPEDLIEPWLSEQRPPPEIAALLEDLIWDLPPPSPAALPLARGVWGGAAQAADCQHALIAQAVRHARDRQHGLFCWLNLLETVAHARALPALRRPDVTILLLDGDDIDHTHALSRDPEAPDPPNPPEAGPRSPRTDSGLLRSLLRALASIFAPFFDRSGKRW